MTANDRDLDGLDNDTEDWLGTDPDNPDTDGDGLNDYDEYNAGPEYGGWALDPDSDNDGLTDGQEAQWGTDFLDQDTDDDRVADGVEVQEGKNPLDPTDQVTPEAPATPPTMEPSPTSAAEGEDSVASQSTETCMTVMPFFEICAPSNVALPFAG